MALSGNVVSGSRHTGVHILRASAAAGGGGDDDDVL